MGWKEQTQAVIDKCSVIRVDGKTFSKWRCIPEESNFCWGEGVVDAVCCLRGYWPFHKEFMIGGAVVVELLNPAGQVMVRFKAIPGGSEPLADGAVWTPFQSSGVVRLFSDGESPASSGFLIPDDLAKSFEKMFLRDSEDAVDEPIIVGPEEVPVQHFPECYIPVEVETKILNSWRDLPGGNLRDYIRSHSPGPFKIAPHYCKEMDSVEIYFTDESAYAETVNASLTLYKSMKTNEIVGCKIFGVKDLIK